MTRETDHPASSPAAPDDDTLATLVRAVVDDWRLPPQRLDQPTWRDRVGDRHGRRQRGWIARLAGPAAAAIVGTVVVAFVAVWLTAPRTSPGIVAASPGATGSAPNRTSSPRPTASGLPGVLLYGALPDPARVMVLAGDTYRVADLATGTLGGPSIGAHSGPTTLVPGPDGWSCICGDWTDSSAGRPSGLDLTLVSVKADGTPGSTTPLRMVRGEIDPTVAEASQPAIVDAGAVGSADGRYAFVGWSARQGAAGWTAGIDVVDVVNAKVLSSTPLALTEPAGAGGRPTTRIAPTIALSPSGDAVLVSSFWYVADDAAVPPSGTDHLAASFDGRTLGPLSPAGSTAGDLCAESNAGLIDPTRYYVVCSTPDARLLIKRTATDGTAIDETPIPGGSTGLETSSLVVRQGDQLFVWNPVMTRLVRFDLRTGVVDSATGTALAPTTSPGDAIAALGRQLGRWLAPPVAAKVLLEPALVISPDGKRIYGLGIDPLGVDGNIGSRGIYAFDTESFTPIAHWTTTVDLDSLAISPDGRFVYAAGLAGVDSSGRAVSNEASITVYDTTDGTVRLVAGKLGVGGLLFPGPLTR